MLFFSKLGGTVVAVAKAHSFRRSPFVFQGVETDPEFCAFFGTILKLLDMPEERLERMWFASGEYESVIKQKKGIVMNQWPTARTSTNNADLYKSLKNV